MDRRRFLLTSLAGALAAPLDVDAQPAGIARIGLLSPVAPGAIPSPKPLRRRWQSKGSSSTRPCGSKPGKAIAWALADLEQWPRPAAPDVAQVERRLLAIAGDVRGTLEGGGPAARTVLSCVLGGRRVACEGFREPGRRGYRFSTGPIPYAAVFTDMRVPTRMPPNSRVRQVAVPLSPG